MNTSNGFLGVRIEGDKICMSVDDCDVPIRAVAEMDVEQVKTLRAALEEALIGVECGTDYATLTRLNQ